MFNTNEDDDQDIARSSYADMVLDDERNHAYHMAIKANINHLVKSSELNPSGNRFFKCCDIGTGSGLLSMMIVKTFRDLNYANFHVTAFETFKPMAECARKIIQTNGMSDKISVIATRAEDYKENPQFDLLVAELLDTELIGEGCLLTYRHAVEKLCSPNCIFIPSDAHIYIQVLESPKLWKRNHTTGNCPGLPEIDDMQLSQVKEKFEISEKSGPHKIFSFKFGDLDTLKLDDHTRVACDSAQVQFPVVAMWWDIVMYDRDLYERYLKTEHKYAFLVLSCAPNWVRRHQYEARDRFIEETYAREVWREHWMQAIYYLRDQAKQVDLTHGLNAYHDSHSLWFSLAESDSLTSCSCNFHRLLSRSEMSLWNELKGSHLDNLNLVRCLRMWDSLLLADTKTFRESQSCKPFHIEKLTIMCAQVDFKSLNRIKMRVEQCQGFDLSHLDDLIESSSRRIDASCEPQPLIEYEFTALGQPFTLISVNFADPLHTDFKPQQTIIELETPPTHSVDSLKQGWALIFWPVFQLRQESGNATTLITGAEEPQSGPLTNKNMSEHFKQLIHFLHDHPALNEQSVPVKIKLIIDIGTRGIDVRRHE